jgi:predicted N-acetyltransferase YhbS
VAMEYQPAEADITSPVVVRRARPEDAQSSGQICYEAFRTLNDRHAFPPDFPAPSVAIDVVSMMFSHSRFYCVAAEFEGQLVGSNCLDERGPIAGIGPITVDPTVQDRGVGRSLM